MRRGWCFIFMVLGLASCAPSAIDGGFDSANPAARMYAIEHAARTGDVEATRDIVEQLESDDPAVRLLAIGALERLTGETFGYCHGDPPHRRQVAINRWRKALDQDDFTRIVHQANEPITASTTNDGQSH